MEVSQTIKSRTASDPAIHILGVYSKEMQTGCWRDPCTRVLLAALLTMAKTWKQSVCLSMDEMDKENMAYI